MSEDEKNFVRYLKMRHDEYVDEMLHQAISGETKLSEEAAQRAKICDAMIEIITEEPDARREEGRDDSGEDSGPSSAL